MFSTSVCMMEEAWRKLMSNSQTMFSSVDLFYEFRTELIQFPPQRIYLEGTSSACWNPCHPNHDLFEEWFWECTSARYISVGPIWYICWGGGTNSFSQNSCHAILDQSYGNSRSEVMCFPFQIVLMRRLVESLELSFRIYVTNFICLTERSSVFCP